MAGVEGGSKRAVESEWSLDDVRSLWKYWSEQAPPVHISLMSIASYFGIELLRKEEIPQAVADAIARPEGPSIADLAIAPLAPGTDVSQASLEILQKMGLG